MFRNLLYILIKLQIVRLSIGILRLSMFNKSLNVVDISTARNYEILNKNFNSILIFIIFDFNLLFLFTNLHRKMIAYSHCTHMIDLVEGWGRWIKIKRKCLLLPLWGNKSITNNGEIGVSNVVCARDNASVTNREGNVVTN